MKLLPALFNRSLLLLAAISLLGCRKEEPVAAAEAPREQPASEAAQPPESAEVPGAEMAAREPMGAVDTASKPPLEELELAAPPSGPADEDEEEDPEERKDYWAKIAFTMANFEEVREYVKTYYIDGNVDEQRAYVEAASFVIGELDPPRVLIPEAFYNARKGLPEEEGDLDGKTYKIDKGDPFVVLIPVEKDEAARKEEAKKRKKLTDDEIRKKRDEYNARRELLEKEWSKIPFDRKRLDGVLDHVRGAIKGTKQESEAKGDPMKSFYLAAAQGYLYALDPHSSLVSAEAWDESTKSTTDSSFEGIGAVLTQQNEETLVESPLDGRPAATAGVRAGDKIVKVDGKDVTGLPLHKVVKRIRGPRGTVVKLSVIREGEPDEKLFEITRAQIEMKNVSGRLLEPHHPGIAYVKVMGFVPDTATDIEKKLEELSEENAKLHDGAPLRGLIFDLRNNSGGLLAQGVHVSDLFLESGVIVEVRSRTKREEAYRARADGNYDLPLIVLVNDGSASASEIVASAIQDNGRGLVVGDRTFGKASVQTLFTPILRKDYYIKLTIARYFGPSGRTLQVTGVEPDFYVSPEIGKPMPVGFREENLSHILKPLDTNYTKPQTALVEKVKSCAELRGVAEKIHQNDPRPQIKFDHQLMKAADYMECFGDTVKTGALERGSAVTKPTGVMAAPPAEPR